MKTSSKGIQIIKESEGCATKAYICPAGKLTIGYGRTTGVSVGQTITKAQAEEYLKVDLVRYEKKVDKYSSIYDFNQNQFDALVSFAYNIGSIDGLTKNGTRTIKQISDKFNAYIKGDGRVLPGLVTRRAKEKKLFDTPVSKPTTNTKYDIQVLSIQKWLNKTYKAGLVEDGIYGSKTKATLVNLMKKDFSTLKKGSTGNRVRLLQSFLYCEGFDTKGIDGSFGTNTEKAVIAYQKVKGLVPDGKVGNKTFTKICA